MSDIERETLKHVSPKRASQILAALVYFLELESTSTGSGEEILELLVKINRQMENPVKVGKGSAK